MEPQSCPLAEAAVSSAAAPAPALRVLLDARKLGDGGIGVYLENLAAGLSLRGDVRLTLVGDAAQIRQYPWSASVQIIEDAARPYSLDELFLMPRRLKLKDFDLFHSPHYTLPFGLKIPAVVTIHDLIHVKVPPRRFHPWLAAPMIRSALRRAARVVVVSQATYREVCDLVKTPGIISKLRVVPNALDPAWLAAPCSRDYLRSRFHLQDPYLLAVISMLKPHKGLEDLLQAFARLKQMGFAGPGISAALQGCLRDLKLILVGKGAESLVVAADKLLKQAGAIDGVHILGAVSRHDLGQLYWGALALVVPSLAEGFCLPALEAKAFGTAVVARPAPALGELLDDNDLICRDFSVGALTEGMYALLQRKSKMPRGFNGGRIRPRPGFIEQYSIETVASDTLGIYREALAPVARPEKAEVNQ